MSYADVRHWYEDADSEPEEPRTWEEIEAERARQQAEHDAWKADQTTWSIAHDGVVLERDRTQRTGWCFSAGPDNNRYGQYGKFVQAWWLVAVDPEGRTATVVREGERRTIPLRNKKQVAAYVRELTWRRRNYNLWSGRESHPPGYAIRHHFAGPAPDPLPGERLGLR